MIIENNIFYPASMASIFLSNDSGDWYESGPISDMTIRNNTFYVKDIGGKTSWWYASAIYIHPVTTTNKNNKNLAVCPNPIHKNIMIEGNTFYMDQDTVVKAENVEDLTFKNNKVLRMYADINLVLGISNKNIQTGNSVNLTLTKNGNTNDGQIDNIFNIMKSKNVRIEGNTYDDGLKRYVVTDSDSRSTLQLSDPDISITDNENQAPSEAVGNITYVSTKPGVAHVDQNGKVTGVSAGSAEIYAYYRWNGTNISGN